MDSKYIENNAKYREYSNERKAECYLCCFVDKFEFSLIKPCEEKVSCHITHKQYSADDGQSQLSHTLAEKHDAHDAQEDDNDEKYAQTVWACTLETLERTLCMECEVGECCHHRTFYEIFTNIGNESYEREDYDQSKVNGL